MTKNILNFHKETARIFATNLLQWFYKSKRALPFRETKKTIQYLDLRNYGATNPD